MASTNGAQLPVDQTQATETIWHGIRIAAICICIAAIFAFLLQGRIDYSFFGLVLLVFSVFGRKLALRLSPSSSVEILRSTDCQNADKRETPPPKKKPSESATPTVSPVVFVLMALAIAGIFISACKESRADNNG